MSMKGAVAALLRGELVGMPTETVYGLAADALNAPAVARIFQAKERPAFDPLICHVAGVEEAEQLWETPLSEDGLKLARAFWPGPLTLVKKKRPGVVPDITTSGLETVAVRVPSHPLARELLREVGRPLAAPSANLFGHVSPTRADHVTQQLGDRVAVVLDGGDCRVGVESTIVLLEGETTVLRFGGVSLEEIERVLGHKVPSRVSSDRPEAPGQLSKHYATRKPLRLYSEGDSGDTLMVVSGPAPPGAADRFARVVLLSEDANMEQSAHRLFSTMRQLDADPSVSSIHAVACERRGLGHAIMDRLVRASAGSLDPE